MPADRMPAGTRHPHDGLPAPHGGVRRRVHLRAAGRRRSRSASSAGLDYRDPMFDPHVALPALQAAPARGARCSRAARWCATARRRCPKAAGTRFRGVYADGRPDRRRRRRVPELDAPEGHPPRDADRHARGRDGVRGGPQRATRRPRALQAYEDGDRRERRAHGSCIRSATSTRASATACSRAWPTPGCRWSPAAGGFAIRCRRTPATSGCRRSRTTTATAGPIRTRR